MVKDHIENIVRKNIRKNVKQHPQAFPDTLPEITKLSKILADSYWEHRDRIEVKRDKRAGVTDEDYRTWCLDELTELKKVVLYN